MYPRIVIFNISASSTTTTRNQPHTQSFINQTTGCRVNAPTLHLSNLHKAQALAAWNSMRLVSNYRLYILFFHFSEYLHKQTYHPKLNCWDKTIMLPGGVFTVRLIWRYLGTWALARAGMLQCSCVKETALFKRNFLSPCLRQSWLRPPITQLHTNKREKSAGWKLMEIDGTESFSYLAPGLQLSNSRKYLLQVVFLSCRKSLQ